MKKIVFSAMAVLSLSACVQKPIYQPMTEAEVSAVSCRDLWKDSERLTRVINNVRSEYPHGVPAGRDVEVLDAAQARLNQVRELSVQNMCTYG